MKTQTFTFAVQYTKRNGQQGQILVKAHNEAQAIGNARSLCATGKYFRNAVLTDKEYSKPRKQGFAGFN